MPHHLLAGERLKLTTLSDEDLHILTNWYTDSRFLRRFDALPPKPKSFATLQEWRDQASKDNNHFLFAMREAHKFIGYVELEGILWSQRNGWVTIGIGEELNQGKGYGTEAMELIMEYAFQELNLHRLQLTVFEYNTAAIRMYEKLGFTREGAHREFILRDGEAYDMYLYGILHREWKEKYKGS
ncbi:GNAT family N-acetyltransferase [Halobacillus salinarum]|uniref:GNAT family N-acetyltransferase n=1 Tax=Halobacillus salinarum TaxID=2932257 RepID=A0ABY4EJI7_9BACI|nr:GNAT family protein [Halobacillus salinarum]UOQ44329.1 GNAT family N-acetyltransferase [Halobacillus salinarum]